MPTLYGYSVRSGMTIVTYHGDSIISTSANDPYVEEESHINSMRIVPVENFVEAVNFPPSKCMIVGDPIPLAALEQQMANDLGDKMEVCRSAPFFLELTPKGIDKALSLRRLLSHLQLSPADMIACGDGYNDLSMIRLAGMGVAMANAQPEVRAAADFVTSSNDEDGVAAVVEKFVL